MGLEESDGDKHQDGENKHDQQDPKMKQKDQIFSTLNQMGMSISKMTQLDTRPFRKHNQKEKKAIKANWRHQKSGDQAE